MYHCCWLRCWWRLCCPLPPTAAFAEEVAEETQAPEVTEATEVTEGTEDSGLIGEGEPEQITEPAQIEDQIGEAEEMPAASAEADTAAEVDGDWEYTVNSGVATITGYNGSETVVTVPKMFGNYLVTSIGKNAFKDYAIAQQIILHDRIVSIGDYAFSGCAGLKSIELPKSVATLGIKCFQNCVNVTSITIYSTTLGNCASQYYDGGLYDITYPFYGVGAAGSGITLTFGEGCTKVPVALFYCYNDAASKPNIKTVILADTVTTIGADAFDGCDTIEHLTLSNNLTSIGRYAFSRCTNLQDFQWPATLDTLGYGAFNGCASLTKLELDVHTIGDYAFQGCVGAKSIVLKENVGSLGWGSFKNCTSVDTITVYSGNLTACAGEYYDKTLYDIRRPFYGVGTATDGVTLTFTGNCHKVPVGMFYGYNDAASIANLKTVIFTESVTTVSNRAFNGCDTIEKVVFSPNILSIGPRAFSVCYALKEIDFQGNAPAIDATAFNKITAQGYYRLGTNWTEDKLVGYGGDITWNCIVPTPDKPYKIANVVSGVHVYWNSVNGVSKYGLWRSETGKDGEYKWLANPTVAHFTDLKVQSGKTYYYKVTLISPTSGEHSEMSEPIGITYVSTPDITSRFNKAAGITLGWEKIEGATGYAIYRKSYYGSDDWVRIGTIEGNTTFTWQDTSVKNNNGEVYKYTIRALAGSDMKTLSGCRAAGRTMARLCSRTLQSAVPNGDNAVKCKWTTSGAVTGYEVRFMVNGQVYKTFTVGNYATGVKTFTGLPEGQTYKVQVRSYLRVGDMGFYSAWSTAKNVTI